MKRLWKKLQLLRFRYVLWRKYRKIHRKSGPIY